MLIEVHVKSGYKDNFLNLLDSLKDVMLDDFEIKRDDFYIDNDYCLEFLDKYKKGQIEDLKVGTAAELLQSVGLIK
jgi:hypothetical protein